MWAVLCVQTITHWKERRCCWSCPAQSDVGPVIVHRCDQGYDFLVSVGVVTDTEHSKLRSVPFTVTPITATNNTHTKHRRTGSGDCRWKQLG